MRTLLKMAALALLAVTGGCMEAVDIEPEDISATGKGVFIGCEGNFQYGNASLSYYLPESDGAENEIFARANGQKLGDVVQSLTIHDGKLWIVVNNSHVIFAINATSLRETGRIEGLTSPRYIHFLSDDKAYVTQLWDNRIFIVDPRRYAVTGYIDIPGMQPGNGSTERMVQIGQYVYCNCWSYQNSIIKIDTATDRVVASLEVGIQPNSLVADSRGRLWTICDGGYEGSPYGHETPSLVCIDTETFTVARRFVMAADATPRSLLTSGDGNRLYWLDDEVWSMSITATALPTMPLLPSCGTKYYGLTISPYDGDIYVADAVDYQQPGRIYRYSQYGELLDSFYVGINPSSFCWK